MDTKARRPPPAFAPGPIGHPAIWFEPKSFQGEQKSNRLSHDVSAVNIAMHECCGAET
jgi:hypothetical protein